MLKGNNELLLSVDMLLHLNDLNRHCDKSKVSYNDVIIMGTRFVHTFYNEPIHPKYTLKNHDYLTRLKMFNIQL